VFSYLFRRGRCRYCGEKIPAGCLASELAGAAAFLCLGLRFGWALELGQWLVFAALLLALSLTDLAKRLIPDKLLLLLAANRAAWFFVLGGGVREGLEILKALAVPAALLALVLGMEKLSGREVMGGGDIKLLFVFALYLRWPELLLALLAACLLGLAWALLSGGKRGSALPFGPFLALGALITLCCGGPVLDWYFALF
jgi:leader peptidase (prepilin peptidase)/N-methyltransferase